MKKQIDYIHYDIVENEVHFGCYGPTKGKTYKNISKSSRKRLMETIANREEEMYHKGLTIDITASYNGFEVNSWKGI